MATVNTAKLDLALPVPGTNEPMNNGAILSSNMDKIDKLPYEFCTSTTRPSTPSVGDIIYETDKNRLRLWDGSQWAFIAGDPPRCMLRNQVGGSIPGATITPIPFETEDLDTDGMHDPVTNNTRITTNEKGLYYFEAGSWTDQMGEFEPFFNIGGLARLRGMGGNTAWQFGPEVRIGHFIECQVGTYVMFELATSVGATYGPLGDSTAETYFNAYLVSSYTF